MHVSGEQLDQYTGIAAILRFPMTYEGDVDPDVQDSSDDEDGKQNSNHNQEMKSNNGEYNNFLDF
jgi:hypothetical protein